MLNIHLAQAQSPPWLWAKGIHTTASEYATDIAFDPSSGNVVEVGIFNGDLSAYFGLRFLGAIGGGYVAKYDPTGAVIWAFPIGNNQDDACNGVTVDALGNIYVTGYLQQIADFKGTGLLSTILFSSGGKDIFIAKYDSFGQLIWVKQAGSTTDDEGTAVCVNSAGVYITGYYTGAANFGGTGPAVLTGTDNKAYTAAYDINGNNLWFSVIGNSGSDAFGQDICADNANVFITGKYEGASAGFYNSATPAATLTNASPSSYDGFTASFAAATGIYNWAAGIHSNNDDYSNGIAQAGSNLYITGTSRSSTTFSGYPLNPVVPPGTGFDVFVAQLNKSNGNAVWVKSEGGTNDQQGMSVSVDTTNLVTVTGFFTGAINFTGGTSISSSGNEDVFVAAYNTSGSFQWANQAGDNGTDIGHAITTGGIGEIYVAGEYEKNAVFGATTLTQDSPPNIFTAKMGCPPVLSNTVSASQTVCSNQTPALLNGSVPSGGSGSFNFLWQQSPDNITWSAATGTNNTQNYSPPLLTSNTYYRRIVLATAGCYNTSTSNTILISVSQMPSTAITMPDHAVCSNTTGISANNPSSGTGNWSVLAGTATVTTPSSYSTTASGLSPGLNMFLWTISTSTVCAASKDTLKITVNAPPSPANAGSSQTHCAANSLTLTANNPTIGTGTWSVVSGAAIIASPNTSTTSVSGLSNGQTVFMWTISNGACPSSSSTVSVNDYALPSTAIAVASQTMCAAASATISANNPTIGTGSWSVISGAAFVASPSSATTSVNGLSVGQNIFKWTITNGVCPASTATTGVFIDAVPTTANAGSSQILCGAASAALSANNPTVGTGSWTTVSGPATVSPSASANAAANGLSIGQNIFMWTISNGSCPLSSDTTVVYVYAPPTIAQTGPDQVLCTTSTTLTANLPSVGTGVWTALTSGETITSPTTNTTTVSNLSAGQNVFVWTISNGICPSSRDTVHVQVNTTPSIANAGPDQLICASSSVLNALPVASGSGSWQVLSGTGIISSSGSYTTVVTGLSDGSNYFEWTVSNGACPLSRDTVLITVSAMPSIAFAGIDQPVCTNTATLIGNVPIVGTGTWSSTGGAQITSFNTNSTTVTNLTQGQNIFIWTISNGVCPPSADTINVIRYAQPVAANAGPDQLFCALSTATLTANNTAVGSGIWSVISGSGLIANNTNNASTVTNLSVGQNIFVWTVSNGVCPSTSDTTSITIDAMPTIAYAGKDTVIYSSSMPLNANVPVSGNGIWSIVSGNANFINNTSANTEVTGLNNGQTILKWTISNGVCPASYDEVTITVKAFLMPTGFSPNGDGVNDNFEIAGLEEYNSVKINVFNRWGNTVYDNDNYKNNWNGKNMSGEDLTDDTYFVVIEIPDKKTYKGYVVLKRK